MKGSAYFVKKPSRLRDLLKPHRVEDEVSYEVVRTILLPQIDYDEYNRLITWTELKKTAIDRATWSPVPQKWVYELDEIFLFNKNKTLHTVECTPEDADLWIPFDHVVFQKTEIEATKRFHLNPSFNLRVKYWNDPDYPVDWTEGDFS